MLLPGSYTARIALRSSTKPEIMEKSVNVMFVVQPGPQLSVLSADRHDCAVDRNGETYCWGTNGGGQLGTGARTGFQPAKEAAASRSQRSRPAKSTPAAWWQTVTRTAGAAPRTAASARPSNSTNAVLSPLKVPGNIQWENIEAGRYHTCAVASTGVAYCWVMASAMLRADARCGRTGRLDVCARISAYTVRSPRTTRFIAGAYQREWCGR